MILFYARPTKSAFISGNQRPKMGRRSAPFSEILFCVFCASLRQNDFVSFVVFVVFVVFVFTLLRRD